MLARPGYGGLLGAVLFFCLSMTPSLLPRSWPILALIAGFTSAIGYGVGAMVGWAGRRLLAGPGRTAGRTAWILLAATASTLLVGFLAAGRHWQQNLREQLGVQSLEPPHSLPIVLGAALVAAVLVIAARTVRAMVRCLGRGLGRFLPRPVSTVLAAALTALFVVGLVRGFAWRGFLALANDSASLANTGTPPAVAPPTSPNLSGGPGSLIPWDTLGFYGRAFTGRVPDRDAIAQFARAPASDPIRIYAGMDSADTLQAQVDLALRELDRTGAWDRSVLAVFTSTGTGWIDPLVADSLEYLHRGDTAEVTLQYSYLPSWVSFLADRDRVGAAGDALISAVHARWAQLPRGERPTLLVFGESLGSYGTESAFRDLDDLASRTDGALLVGPVNSNPIWSRVTAARDPGSTQWLPVYQDGRTVRFADQPADLTAPPAPWPRPRVVYLQNSSDPVVWWSPTLLFESPGWLAGRRGPDVPIDMHWYPIITFWQVVMDLSFAAAVPPGHGHLYGTDVIDGWAAVAAPPGWTDADTARLRDLLHDR